jgi:hypothetical protein
MLDRDSLPAALGRLRSEGKVARVDQYAYRSIALRHFLPPKTPAPLYAATSGALGTRFVSPVGPAASLYMASSAETAHREGNQIFYQALENFRGDLINLNPPAEVVLIGIHVRLVSMLDVRDPEVMARLGTNRDELVGPWKTVHDAPTQRLGDAVAANGGFEGLIYVSAQDLGGTCMVVFPGRLARGSFVLFRSRTLGVPDARLGVAPRPGMAGHP